MAEERRGTVRAMAATFGARLFVFPAGLYAAAFFAMTLPLLFLARIGAWGAGRRVDLRDRAPSRKKVTPNQSERSTW